jgi:hypothetical protein
VHVRRRGWGRKCDGNLRVSENGVVRPVSLPSFLDNLSTMLSVRDQHGEGEDERRYMRRERRERGAEAGADQVALEQLKLAPCEKRVKAGCEEHERVQGCAHRAIP